MSRFPLFAPSVFLLLSIIAPVLTSARETSPWPAPVPSHQPVEPGEHPRLFFRKDDLPNLRERAKTREGKALIARLKVLLGGGESMPDSKNNMTSAYGKTGGPKPGEAEWPEGTYSISHAAGFGFLYQITGHKKYADLGRECFEWAFDGVRDRDREGRYSFKRPGGALRAGPSLGWYAVGYDLCYGGWDPEFRRKVASAIQNYDEGKYMRLEDLVDGRRHMPSSNHWGMQVGGGALALLAIMGDAGADPDRIANLLPESEKAMERNLTEGFGTHGWFPEGDGTGVMAANISFAPALQAWRNAAGKDFISPKPNAPWMYLKWVHRTVPRDGEPEVVKLGAYPHNVFDRTGISGPGTFSIGFGTVLEKQKPALLWLYNRIQKKYDEEHTTPFETTSGYPHHAIMAFINWPYGVVAKNPIGIIPNVVADNTYGFYSMRQRWQDENDILIQIQTMNTRGWHRAQTKGEIHVSALGKNETWGSVPGKLAVAQLAEDGSAILTGSDGSGFAADFSGASGADAVLAFTGRPVKADAVAELGDTKIYFRFFNYPDGSEKTPEVKVGDGTIHLGGQTIRWDTRKFVLGEFTGGKSR